MREQDPKALGYDPLVALSDDEFSANLEEILQDVETEPELEPDELAAADHPEQPFFEDLGNDSPLDSTLDSMFSEPPESDEVEEFVASDPEESEYSDIEFDHNLDIRVVSQVRQQLLDVINSGKPIRLHAGELEIIDGAGVQLLAAFFKTASQQDIEVTWNSVSDALREAVSAMALEVELALW